MPYRELHTLPVTPPNGVTVYSGAWGRSYKVTEKPRRRSITAGLLANHRRSGRGECRVSRRRARLHRSGAGGIVYANDRCDPRREAAPGAGGSRGQAGCGLANAAVGSASLIAERVPVESRRRCTAATRYAWAIANGKPEAAARDRDSRSGCGRERDSGAISRRAARSCRAVTLAVSVGVSAFPGVSLAPIIAATCDVQVATMQAQEVFLRVNQRMHRNCGELVALSNGVVEACAAVPFAALPSADSGSRLIGKRGTAIADLRAVLRVCGRARSPTCSGRGSPRSMPSRRGCACPMARLHSSIASRASRASRARMTPPAASSPSTPCAPTLVSRQRPHPHGIAVEAGQADLFLSGFLGIDFADTRPGRLSPARRRGHLPSRPAARRRDHRLRHPHRRLLGRATPGCSASGSTAP